MAFSHRCESIRTHLAAITAQCGGVRAPKPRILLRRCLVAGLDTERGGLGREVTPRVAKSESERGIARHQTWELLSHKKQVPTRLLMTQRCFRICTSGCYFWSCASAAHLPNIGGGGRGGGGHGGAEGQKRGRSSRLVGRPASVRLAAVSNERCCFAAVSPARCARLSRLRINLWATGACLTCLIHPASDGHGHVPRSRRRSGQRCCQASLASRLNFKSSSLASTECGGAKPAGWETLL